MNPKILTKNESSFLHNIFFTPYILGPEFNFIREKKCLVVQYSQVPKGYKVYGCNKLNI